MDSDREEEVQVRGAALMCMLALGGVSLIFFGFYWCCCRRSRIPGVVLALPNSVQPNTVMSSPHNATGAPQYVMVVGQNVQGQPHPAMEPVSNIHGAPYPVMAVNQQIGAQYPAGAPPSYSQTHQPTEEQALLFKPAMHC